MKRAVGVLAMLLLLHLTLAGGDLACATHGAPARASVHQGHAPVAEHHGHSTGAHSAQKEQCETPVSTDCCTEQVPCGPTLDLADVITGNRSFTERVIPRATASAALLRFTAPEPPPPRA